MFVGLSILFTAWLGVQGVQPTVAVVSGPGSVYEVEAGYRAGIRHEVEGRSGLAFTAAAFLALTPSGRSLTLAAYSSGGEISFFTELDRTGVRLKTPAWAKPMVDAALAEFLKEVPSANSPALVHALLASREIAQVREADFRAQVDDEIRIALLGARPYHHPSTGWSSDLAELSVSDVQAFFRANFGTDRAFLQATWAPPAVANVEARSSTGTDRSTSRPVAVAQRVFRFPDQESGGAVVFAAPVTSVFYRSWYAVLMLDQIIQTNVPGYPSSTLVPALHPYYYRFEVPVPAGQTADMVEQTVMQELERLQFVRAPEETMNRARSGALEFLESSSMRNWFTSLGIDDRRQEGIEWVRSLSADDLRVAARDLLLANRVVAMWSQKPKQLRVETENLSTSDLSTAASAEPAKPAPLPAVTVSDFPPHPAHEDKVTSQGPGAAANLPATLVLKAFLDRRLIETGLWSRGSISLRPADAQGFVVAGSATAQAQILAWIKEVSNTPPAAADVEWAREAAVHRLEAAPGETPGVFASQLQRVAPEHLQDVARIHLANR